VIFDDTITKEVFERHLTEAGRFVGIGRFRPENGGIYGRFTAGPFSWSELTGEGLVPSGKTRSSRH
jgi:hypothetical protein